jgi:hypothetical protein
MVNCITETEAQLTSLNVIYPRNNDTQYDLMATFEYLLLNVMLSFIKQRAFVSIMCLWKKEKNGLKLAQFSVKNDRNDWTIIW